MSEQLQLRRDTQANIATVTPAAGEPAYDTTRAALLIGDGASLGGVPQAALAFFAGYAAGRYYFPGPTSTATATLAANTLYCAPFVNLQKQSFTKLGVEVTTAAGTNGRLGVYNWANGLPTTLLLDAGAVSDASTGYKEITGLGLTLNPGLYGLAFLPDGAVTVRVTAASGNPFLAQLALGASGSDLASELTLSVAQSYGALPSNFPASPSYLAAAPIAIGLRL